MAAQRANITGTRVLIEDNPRRLEIRPVAGAYAGLQLLVIRKQSAQDDDWLGRIDCFSNGTYVAKVEFKGNPTDWHREFKSEDEAIQWLASLAPDERERAYYRYRREQNRISNERAARDRRERPQWYNDDGSHIGINSDGSFRSSYRNTR
jgi:hypothetical protein